MRKKVTLKEIADILNVSIATVSKALRDSPDISDSMCKTVKSLADKLGYRPNLLAKSLINQDSHLIGTIIPDLSISFYSEAVRGIYEQARKKSYQAILMVSDENPDIERQNLEFLSDINVDGILLNNAPGNQNDDLFKRLHEEGIRMVCWDRRLDHLGFPSVSIDDQQAAYALTLELIKAGCRDILFMGPNKGFSVAEQRFSGFCQAMQDQNIDAQPENRHFCCGLNAKDSYRCMNHHLNEHKPEAVVCLGGMVAYGAGHAVLKHGYNIPKDIMIAEFGDNNIVAQLGVSFISIDQNAYEIGQKAVDLLIDRCRQSDWDQPPEHLIEPVRIIHHTKGKPFFKLV